MRYTPGKTSALLLLLLGMGVLLWLSVGHRDFGFAPSPRKLAIVAVIFSLPPVFRRVNAALEQVRHPTPRARRTATLAAGLLATTFLIGAGFAQRRDNIPKIHDEHMHLLQVQMLARGRLWLPPHPAADSFESFHIFVKPVYASIYFPGTALLYVPSAWLNTPYWLMPALVAGAGVAMLFRVVAELLDAVYGLLAAVLLVSLTQFRYLSLIVMSHSVMLLLALLLVWAWLRWRRNPSLAWAAVIGALGGWAAITRPVDALCYAIPIGIAMLWTLRDQPPRRFATTLAVIVASAAPFLAIQLTLNRGVTGKLFETPYRRFCDLNTPQMTFGFHRFDPQTRPQSTLPQIVEFYDKFIVPAAAEHQPRQIWRTWTERRFPLIAKCALPSPLLLILLPPALLALRGPRSIFAAVFILYVCFYACFAFLLRHYIVVVAPAVIVGVLLGVHAVAENFPRRARPWLVTVLTAIVALIAIYAMPRPNWIGRDDPYDFPALVFNQRLPAMVQPPALVLFRYDPSEQVRYYGRLTAPVHEEPVYNIDVAWPDDAPIVRAQDRSAEQNAALFRYYADKQPRRRVYVVDRAQTSDPNYRPQYLGMVGELARESR